MSSAPPSSPVTIEWPSITDENSFDVIDVVDKFRNGLLEKTKCALDAIENEVGEGELKHVYQELRAIVRAILENDLKVCAKVDDVFMQIR